MLSAGSRLPLFLQRQDLLSHASQSRARCSPQTRLFQVLAGAGGTSGEAVTRVNACLPEAPVLSNPDISDLEELARGVSSRCLSPAGLQRAGRTLVHSWFVAGQMFRGKRGLSRHKVKNTHRWASPASKKPLAVQGTLLREPRALAVCMFFLKLLLFFLIRLKLRFVVLSCLVIQKNTVLS